MTLLRRSLRRLPSSVEQNAAVGQSYFREPDRRHFSLTIGPKYPTANAIGKAASKPIQPKHIQITAVTTNSAISNAILITRLLHQPIDPKDDEQGPDNLRGYQ